MSMVLPLTSFHFAYKLFKEYTQHSVHKDRDKAHKMAKKAAGSVSTSETTGHKKTPASKNSAKKETAVEPVKATASVETTQPDPSVEVTAEKVDKTKLTEDASDRLWTGLIDLQAKVQAARSMYTDVQNDLKAFGRSLQKELKIMQKSAGRKNRKNASRSPSGFVKPTRISDELAVFLNKDKGTEMARTDVTREINNYIKEHQLKDTINGRKINADQKLTQLLRLTSDDELTYFNLQRYMSVHFYKKVKVEAEAVAPQNVAS